MKLIDKLFTKLGYTKQTKEEKEKEDYTINFQYHEVGYSPLRIRAERTFSNYDMQYVNEDNLKRELGKEIFDSISEDLFNKTLIVDEVTGKNTVALELIIYKRN